MDASQLARLTPQQKRIRIAELRGWIFHDGRPMWIHGRPPPLGKHEPLDYLNDLNAMHEAENATLDDGIEDAGSLRYRYAGHLYNITTPQDRQPCRATAAQRADAFLLTLG